MLPTVLLPRGLTQADRAGAAQVPRTLNLGASLECSYGAAGPSTRKEGVVTAGTTQFETDLFISYAHIDDQPLSPEQKGWISRFHASLEAMLSMRLGRKARIWRDPKLQGNDVFGDEIVDQFSNAAVLLSVVTPRYLRSDWCTREIREFCAHAQKSGGIVVANKARVFKVLKTPVDTQDSLPEVVKDLLGYEFFRVEGDTPLELDPAYGESFGQDYNRKIGQLAWDVKELVEGLVTSAGPEDQAADGKAAIYLAECSYDRKQDREALEGELRRLGYRVLPDRELPRDEAGYVDSVEGLLSDCELAVHLIGASRGAVPDGPSEKSTVELQNELAVSRSKNAALKRVIWLPEGTHSDHAAQQAFLEALHKDPDAQFGADLITGDLEALKTTIYATLKRLEEPAPEGEACRDRIRADLSDLHENGTARRRSRFASTSTTTASRSRCRPSRETPRRSAQCTSSC